MNKLAYLLAIPSLSAATIDTDALGHLDPVTTLPEWTFTVDSFGTLDQLTFIDTSQEVPGDPDLLAQVGEAFIIQDDQAPGDEGEGGIVTLTFDGEFNYLSLSVIDVEETTIVTILDDAGQTLFAEGFQNGDGEVSGFEWAGDGGKTLIVALGGSGAFTVPSFNPIPEPATGLLALAGSLLLTRRKRDYEQH